MLSGELSSSLAPGWRSIRLIRWTFNIWVHPPGRSIADKAGGKGDFADNLNVAAPSWWNSDQEALPSSSVFEMYSTAVIRLIWARDSFSVACRVWLPCPMSNKSLTLAIPCNLFSSASLFISMSLSVLLGSNIGSSPASNLLLPRANCLTTTFLQRVSPLVFHCIHPITSRPREKLVSTPTPWGSIDNMSHATLARSAYFQCVSSCCRHQSVISGT